MSLKNYRINKKITQEEVARATNINLRTYQNIERTNDCKLKLAKQISNFFNDNIDNIFYKKNEV